MNCGFVDSSNDFAGFLAAKAGSDVSIVPFDPAVEANLLNFEVIAVRIPPVESPEHAQQMEQLKACILNQLGVPVIAFLPAPDNHLLRTVISAGAYDYFIEKSSMEELRIVLRRAAQFYRLNCEMTELRAARNNQIFSAFNSANPKVLEACRLGERVTNSDATLLVTGETGTGKEMLARLIHDCSRRAKEPFMAVCCSALPESLIESELFGHEKGAFTGAVASRQGRFEAAGTGTLFLDEIGELSLPIQVKLLRVLQERTFERVGSNTSRPLQARIICATHRDLKAMVQENIFRADLYYRLNTFCLHLPPLRERPEDIVLLGLQFLRQFAAAHGSPAKRFQLPALQALKSYAWPGNVRELANVIERSTLLCDGPEVGVDCLPSELAPMEIEQQRDSLEFELRNHKRLVVERTLREHHFNKSKAARALGISRGYLHRLIVDLKLPPEMAPKAS